MANLTKFLFTRLIFFIACVSIATHFTARLMYSEPTVNIDGERIDSRKAIEIMDEIIKIKIQDATFDNGTGIPRWKQAGYDDAKGYLINTDKEYRAFMYVLVKASMK